MASPPSPHQQRWTINATAASAEINGPDTGDWIEVVPAAAADRLAEALEKIQRSGIEEPYHRNIVRDALAEFRSLSSPAEKGGDDA